MNARSTLVAVGGRARTISSLMCIVTLLMCGCASTETVKESKGQGVTRVYPYASENVFNATLAAARDKKLDVVESDRQGGRLILAKGVTWLSWGERIAVFIKPVASNSTEVEIVSKPVLSPLNFPPDWQQILLDQIDVDLRAVK